MPRTTYEVHYTVRAAETRDRLGDRQRDVFDHGIALLAREPYHPKSRANSSTGNDRTVRLTPAVLVDDTMSRGRLLIFEVAAFDAEEALVGEG